MNKLIASEEQSMIQWARDNFHQKVGVSGNIRAIWHPTVRREMWRLKQQQMKKIREKASELDLVAALRKKGVTV